MEIIYGPGTYAHAREKYDGTIVLGEHKLFLKGPEGDLPQTYIPLEKIARICNRGKCLDMDVRLTMSLRRDIRLCGQGRAIRDLVQELAVRQGLKKKFLRAEWTGDLNWR
jgi:hypothetical protein